MHSTANEPLTRRSATLSRKGRGGLLPDACPPQCLMPASDPDDAVFASMYDRHWRESEAPGRGLWWMLAVIVGGPLALCAVAAVIGGSP